MQNTSRFSANRRAALSCALAASTMPCANAIANVARFPELSLKLYNLHTTETVDRIFWVDGQYDIEALAEFNRLLRDHRTNQIKPIDPRLFSLLYLLNKKIDNHRAISVISGFRSPETNRMLAERNAGVALNSFHIKGRAIDIRIPGKDTRHLKDIGIKLGVGGVGYYERSNFAHFDTGPRRSW